MSTRPYRQRARADGMSRTRAGIIDATVSLGMEKATVNVSLADIAERAQVSVQTVLRHFGTRDALIDEALRHGAERIAAERRPPASDIPSAVTTLIDHYESRGDGVILLLAQESTDPRIAQITEDGRRVHREWVAAHLAPSTPSANPDALVDQLVVVTDVYAWKLLRRDRGLDRHAVEDRMLSMVEALLRSASEGKDGTS